MGLKRSSLDQEPALEVAENLRLRQRSDERQAAGPF